MHGLSHLNRRHVAGCTACDASADVACHGLLQVFVNGAFVSGQDWFTFDVSILVAAGIGVTPYVSNLKHFDHLHSINNTYTKCRKEQLHVGVCSIFHFFILADIKLNEPNSKTDGLFCPFFVYKKKIII